MVGSRLWSARTDDAVGLAVECGETADSVTILGDCETIVWFRSFEIS